MNKKWKKMVLGDAGLKRYKRGKWGTAEVLEAKDYKLSLSTDSPSVAKRANKINRKKGYASQAVKEKRKKGALYLVYRKPVSERSKRQEVHLQKY